VMRINARTLWLVLVPENLGLSSEFMDFPFLEKPCPARS
jgi:hypothetical protein